MEKDTMIVMVVSKERFYQYLIDYYNAYHILPERAATLHVREAILWTNGMVLVFDDEGQQMPYFQGIFEARFAMINNIFSGDWHYGDWRRGIISAVPIETGEL